MTEPKIAYSIEEACELLSIGRTSMFELIRDKRLDTVKVGRRRLIPAAELRKLIGDTTPPDTSAPAPIGSLALVTVERDEWKARALRAEEKLCQIKKIITTKDDM